MEIIFKDLQGFKEELVKRGLSQSKLAEEMSASQPYINQLLKGKRNPGVKMAEKISEFMNVPFDSLFEIQTKRIDLEIGKDFQDFPFGFMPLTAKMIGLKEAIVINFIAQWESNYQSAECNYFESHYWIRVKKDQWEDVFIFWSEQETKQIVDKLIKRGLIIVKDDEWFRIDHNKLNTERK